MGLQNLTLNRVDRSEGEQVTRVTAGQRRVSLPLPMPRSSPVTIYAPYVQLHGVSAKRDGLFLLELCSRVHAPLRRDARCVPSKSPFLMVVS